MTDVDPLAEHLTRFLEAVDADPRIPTFLKRPPAAALSSGRSAEAASFCHARCLVAYQLCRLGGNAEHCQQQYEACKAGCT